MSANRREVNRQEITGQIKKKLLAIYSEGGIERVSVGKLCEACGIARSTFYYYYDDKYGVLEDIEDELLGTLWDINTKFEWNIEEIQTGRPAEACLETVRFLDANLDTFRLLLGAHGDPQFSYRWKKGLEQHFHKWFRAVRGDELEAMVGCTIFSSAALGLFTRYVFGISALSPHDFAIILGNLLKYCLFDYQMFTRNLN